MGQESDIKRLLKEYATVCYRLFKFMASEDLANSDKNAQYRQMRVRQYSLEHRIVEKMKE